MCITAHVMAWLAPSMRQQPSQRPVARHVAHLHCYATWSPLASPARPMDYYQGLLEAGGWHLYSQQILLACPENQPVDWRHLAFPLLPVLPHHPLPPSLRREPPVPTQVDLNAPTSIFSQSFGTVIFQSDLCTLPNCSMGSVPRLPLVACLLAIITGMTSIFASPAPTPARLHPCNTNKSLVFYLQAKPSCLPACHACCHIFPEIRFCWPAWIPTSRYSTASICLRGALRWP